MLEKKRYREGKAKRYYLEDSKEEIAYNERIERRRQGALEDEKKGKREE